MPALTLTAVEQAGVAAADASLDTAFTSGINNNDSSTNTPVLPGYAQSQAAGTPPTDLRPSVRWTFRGAWVALVRALASFVEAETAVSSFLNAWSGSGVSYYKDLTSRVYLRGMLNTGTLGVAALQLASGYRPSTTRTFVVSSNGAFGVVTVDNSGNVIPTVGAVTNVSLDGISFRV